MIKTAFTRQLERSANRLARAVEDLSAADAQARPQGLTSVAWQVGHLILYDGILVRAAGVALPVPEGYEELFAQWTDGGGDIPALERLMDEFGQVHGELLRLAAGDLEQPVSGHPVAQNVGEGLIYTQGHRYYHIGKIMTLRSLLDKPVLA